ncbi:enoyl-CoA delta isomerase 3 [Echria macrotheca]|uniref:Enoyl-CoA delta isomerase 3 n=1 Tax=Echria macrotheca TaxID=438768 RepID=A0AAJ0FGP2_9PEZI|nr:enoyl-CoA delta isomerase 3 [Echria macrotheca]
MNTLFTIPIPPLGPHKGGSITATSPASNPKIYLLSITSPPDTRLTHATCQALLDALDLIEFGGYPPGVLVTTSSIPKFYSNGLDLDLAFADEKFLPGYLYRLFRRLVTYPMPTVALLNGHAFAGGLMLALHHDYRIMNPTKGFLCVNELDFGVPLKPAMSAIFRIKLPPRTYRQLVLEAHRFDGKSALEAGIVDGLGGFEEVLRFVEAKKLTKKGETGIYGLMKAEMYRESVELLTEEGHVQGEERQRRMIEEDEERKELGRRRAEEILKGGKGKGGAKL